MTTVVHSGADGCGGDGGERRDYRDRMSPKGIGAFYGTSTFMVQ